MALKACKRLKRYMEQSHIGYTCVELKLFQVSGEVENVNGMVNWNKYRFDTLVDAYDDTFATENLYQEPYKASIEATPSPFIEVIANHINDLRRQWAIERINYPSK